MKSHTNRNDIHKGNSSSITARYTERLKKDEIEERKEERKIVKEEYHIRQIVRIISFITATVVLFIMFGVFVYNNDFGIFPKSQIHYTSECNIGDVRNCTTPSGCAGTQTCITGEWSACSVKQICEPGTVKPCSIHNYGCIDGIKVCNICGTGFSECVDPNKNNK